MEKKDIHQDLDRITVLALAKARAHRMNYNIIIHNPSEEGEFVEGVSTYEIVHDDYFQKERPNTRLLHRTDDLVVKKEAVDLASEKPEMKKIGIIGASPLAGLGRTVWEKEPIRIQTHESMAREEAEKRMRHRTLPKPPKTTLPLYESLTAPKGAKVGTLHYIADFQYKGQIYVIHFTPDVVYGSKNSLKQKINTLETLFIRFVSERTIEEIVKTPRFKVILKEEVSNG